MTTHAERFAGLGLAALVALLVCAAAVVAPASAFADHLTGSGAWTVSYTEDGRLQDNFGVNDFADEIGGLQPGDDITLAVTLEQDNALGADWYMSNEVLESLEDGSSAVGSAYTYRLAYIAPSGAMTLLYDSATVGGDDSKGLVEATGALQDYFFLDTLASGQTATVQLVVALDGETEGNAYVDTLARLKMNFAVEPRTEPDNTTNVTSESNDPQLSSDSSPASSSSSAPSSDAPASSDPAPSSGPSQPSEGSPSPTSPSSSSAPSAGAPSPSSSAPSPSASSTPSSSTTTSPQATPANAPTSSPSSTDSTHRNAVKTGDDTDLFPAFVAMSVSGLLLLLLGADSIRRRIRDRKENAR